MKLLNKKQENMAWHYIFKMKVTKVTQSLLLSEIYLTICKFLEP